jgi:putative ABC transport system permease protein
MLFDLRLALRSLRGQPAVAVALVVIVGLAVAGNTALFSIFDGLLFRPLAYPDVDRLVSVELPSDTRRMMSREEFDKTNAALLSTPLFAERGEARQAVLLEDGAADVTAWGLRPAQISPPMLRMLGVAPAAGRLLADADRGVAPQRVMIGFDLWQSRFGGDRAVIGTVIDVPGVILRRRLELVGVLPRGFSLPTGANLWVAGGSLPDLFNFARLSPGATVEQARAALPRIVITPLREHMRPDGAFAFGVLLAATGFLLLVAWVQVAALLFARASGRTSEIAARLALGATRARLVRQFAAEGLVIAAASLLVAWVVTPALTAAVVRLLPEAVTLGQSLAPDVRTFAFSVAISMAGVLLLSLVPIDLIRRTAPVGLLRGGGVGRVTSGAARTRLAMLTGQLAVTTVLIYMSGLALMSFTAIARVDLGFNPDRVIAVQLPPTTVTGATNEERRAHLNRQVAQWGETLDALRDLPGVTAVAGGPLPFRSSILSGSGGMAVTSELTKEKHLAAYMPLTVDYVRVMGLAIVDGRVPTADELQSATPQALVNTTMARALAPAGPVLGQQLTVNSRTVTVAGVIADFKTARPDLPAAPAVLLLLTRPQGGYVLARVDPAASWDQALAATRATMDRIWPANPSREVMVVSDLAARAIADYRARAVLLGLIGALCLPLAFAGVAGALSYAIGQRTREIGIRLALGARSADIRRHVVAGAMIAVALGLATGIAGGVLVGRLMTAFLFGVQAIDPLTTAAVTLVLLVTVAVAMILPSRRAARIQPAEALRVS